jgi:hypothetical protein
LGQQLCWLLQPEALFAFPSLYLPGVHSRIFLDRGEGWQVPKLTQYLMCTFCGIKHGYPLLRGAISRTTF